QEHVGAAGIPDAGRTCREPHPCDVGELREARWRQWRDRPDHRGLLYFGAGAPAGGLAGGLAGAGAGDAGASMRSVLASDLNFATAPDRALRATMFSS